MSQTSNNQAPRSTPIPSELPTTPQPLPGSSSDQPSKPGSLNPILTFKYSEILYELKVKRRIGSNLEVIDTRNASNQTCDEFLTNAFSQTSNRSKTSAKTAELIHKASNITRASDYSQPITTQQPILSNVASITSSIRPIDPKTAEYDAKKAQFFQQRPQGQYQQGYAPYPPQNQGGYFQQQYPPQYNPAYQQGYQPGYQQGYPQRGQGGGMGGMGGNLKNMACIGSCVACLMLLCTSCCQAVTSSAAGGSTDYGDDDE